MRCAPAPRNRPRGWLLGLLLLAAAPFAAVAGDVWVRVDVANQILDVVRDGVVQRRFEHIAIGRNGYALDRLKDDGRTPLGTFRIGWINPNSKFHLFLGLDYPGDGHAARAWRASVIDSETYVDIVNALYRNRTPPQNTPLGGAIGIHGMGSTSAKVHRTLNWTQGCIALTNAEIVELARWVSIGTRVVIEAGVVALRADEGQTQRAAGNLAQSPLSQ